MAPARRDGAGRPEPSRRMSAVERLWRGEARGWVRWLDFAIAPLELTYRAASVAYHGAYAVGWRAPERLPVPVISVGNLAVGGTGKTPCTRWIVEELRRRRVRPAVLHGGYAPDEPALHRSWYPEVPVVVGRDRVAGGARAIAAGAQALVLDDGFQHRRLARDLDIVLVAAEDWTRTPRLLPRGPWREAPRALARADVVAVTRRVADRAAAEVVAAELRALAPRADVARLHLRSAGWRTPDGRVQDAPPAGEVAAVAGIARPDAFLANAAAAGANIGPVLLYRDHHRYGAHDVRRIRLAAAGRAIATTAKDAVKLARIAPELEIWVLEQSVAVEGGAEALARRLDGLFA